MQQQYSLTMRESVRFWIHRVMKNWCVKCACCLLKRWEEAAVRDISEVKKAAVKQIRDEYKAYVTKTLQAKLFTKEFANLLEDIRENKPAVEMMMTLAQDFYRRMDTEKRERNVIDFNDMEHMALNILVKKTENGMEYTKAADDLSAYYEEILIDEYQDSNMLQEVILTAVSKGKYNEADNNIYMVVM